SRTESAARARGRLALRGQPVWPRFQTRKCQRHPRIENRGFQSARVPKGQHPLVHEKGPVMTLTTLRWLSPAVLFLALVAETLPLCRAAEDPPSSTSQGQTTPIAKEVRPPAYILPPVDQPLVPKFAESDPLLDRPWAPLRGPFVYLETNLVQVHL